MKHLIIFLMLFGTNLKSIIGQTVFTVTNTNDSGVGSFRQAVSDANATPATDTIAFNISGSGPHTIQPSSLLPIISEPVVIDGTTDPDFAVIPVIELDGSNAGNTDGLWISAGNSTVKGLVINRFQRNGILIDTNSGNTVIGNFIGMNVTGTALFPNGEDGVRVVNSSNNIIGGLTIVERNIISGNEAHGINFFGSGSSGNRVEGNYIGIDITGTIDFGNAQDGVRFDGAPDNFVGGLTASPGTPPGNIISGNDRFGVFIVNTGAFGNQLKGNLIGTDALGTVAIGNSNSTVLITRSSNNTIGGIIDSARNVISGNHGPGVRIKEITAVGNRVLGNFIGTQIGGVSPLGNDGDGVSIDIGAVGNFIGGDESGAGNTIAFSFYVGVNVEEGQNNEILSNSIFNNSGSGIDLGDDGLTDNDPEDGDTEVSLYDIWIIRNQLSIEATGSFSTFYTFRNT
jgi:hypothetical protein